MREIQMPLSEAKQRLLAAAESLFAEHGFEPVSVRDITQLAKANVAAINYHFGTRDGLIARVVDRHLPSVNEERLARLDMLERKCGAGKAAPLEEILDAWLRPVTGTVRKSSLSERLSCRLLGRIFAMTELSPIMQDQQSTVSGRFTRAMGKSLPTVAPEDLLWRVHFVTGALIHLLVYQEMATQSTGGTTGTPTLEASLSRLIRFAAAGLREGLEPEPAAKKRGPQALFDFG
jgi:AcrR family transcriptional regulator